MLKTETYFRPFFEKKTPVICMQWLSPFFIKTTFFSNFFLYSCSPRNGCSEYIQQACLNVKLFVENWNIFQTLFWKKTPVTCIQWLSPFSIKTTFFSNFFLQKALSWVAVIFTLYSDSNLFAAENEGRRLPSIKNKVYKVFHNVDYVCFQNLAMTYPSQNDWIRLIFCLISCCVKFHKKIFGQF